VVVTHNAPKKIAVVGAGWAGLSAAISATQAGHQVTLYEASRHWGGRARSLTVQGHNELTLDNGQHILIGAYHQTLRMMQTVGVKEASALWRMPLQLMKPDGTGLSLKHLPFPLNLVWGIATAKGWRWIDKWCLVQKAFKWQREQFTCEAHLSVTDVCKGLTPTLFEDLIEPLCVAALNTHAHEASGAIFLRVMKDALLGPSGSADLLLPRQDLGQIFPNAAIRWLEAKNVACKMGVRVESLTWHPSSQPHWQINADTFDHVVVATTAPEAARLIAPLNSAWSEQTQKIEHAAIATVYIQAPQSCELPLPMMALISNGQAPAQFVFDRGLMCPQAHTPGLLAFVASAVQETKEIVEAQIMQQAQNLLQTLGHSQNEIDSLEVLQTVVEKRATFACTPSLDRPGSNPHPGLSVCGDYIEGPYPATLEGAVMSGIQAILRA
jgi:squalene-associated FAD-dependent desaturase